MSNDPFLVSARSVSWTVLLQISSFQVLFHFYTGYSRVIAPLKRRGCQARGYNNCTTRGLDTAPS